MTSAPSGLKKSADENTDAVANATATSVKPKATPKPKTVVASPAEAAPLPQVPAPNAPVPEGKVEVTHPDSAGETSDPGGKKTEVRGAGKPRAPKKDSLKEIADHTKLPIAVTVGQVVASVEVYAGNPVLSLSLRGWVGEAPLKILASDVGELEQALAELRKELS